MPVKRSSQRVSFQAGSADQKPLWTCPQCGRRFVTRNLYHTCGAYNMADHFTGRDPSVRASFERLCTIVERFGPAVVYAQKTRIVWQVRVRFIHAMTRKQSFAVGVWLRRRVKHPRLARVEDLGGKNFVHQFRFTKPEDLDEAFASLVGESYRVGRQEHLRKTEDRK